VAAIVETIVVCLVVVTADVSGNASMGLDLDEVQLVDVDMVATALNVVLPS